MIGNKKNIWIFNHYIVPPSIETGHRHNKFAKYLVKKGYQVNLFFSSKIHNSKENIIKDPSDYKIEDSDQGKYIAIKTRDYTKNDKKRVFNMLDYFFGLFKTTKKLSKSEGKPDIIYASSVHPLTCVAGILIAKRYKVKCIVEIRDLWPLTLVEMGRIKEKALITKVLYKLEKWIYKKADSLIFTMAGGKDYIKDMGWEKEVSLSKVHHINNGIDLEVFEENYEQYKVKDIDLLNLNNFKVVYTGSLGQANNVKLILLAAEKIQEKQINNIKFILYGDGYEKEELEKYVVNNDIRNVIFKGKVDKKYIPYILKNSDINIISGQDINLYKYGLSLNKLFDYFASGKPILSNIKCGYDLLSKYQCGITVNPGSVDSLVEGILKFYTMRKEEYEMYCHNAIIAALDYDFKILTDKLEKIMIDTMENKTVKMILTNRFDPDVRVYKEAKYLVSKGFSVEILCWDRENDYKHKEFDEIQDVKIKRFFPYSKYGTGYKQIFSYIKFIRACKRYLKAENYSFIHGHDLDGVIAAYLSKNKDSKLIFDMHEFYEGQSSKKSRKFITRTIVNFMHSKSDFIVYLEDNQKNATKEKNINKLVYLPNYPEIKDYEGYEKKPHPNLRVSYIGSVRQYNELKNLMDACRDIEHVEIFIHGAGVSYSKLKEIEKHYPNVNVTGLYHFSESAKLYGETDLLYAVYDISIDNWKYGYPIKFFEAIVTKTPIIVSKDSTLEEFLKEKDIGFVVDGSNVHEIKELINYINKHRYLLKEKIKTLETIQFDYTWERVVKNLDPIYL